MARKRYKQQGTGSFFGEYLYERTVPSGHFLRQLDGLVTWEVFAEKLVQQYHGKAQVGAATVQPVVILKMLLLAYLYDLLERRTEVCWLLYSSTRVSCAETAEIRYHAVQSTIHLESITV